MSNEKELEEALSKKDIKEVTLQYHAQDIFVNRLVNINLNGYTAKSIIYDTNDTGEMNLENTGALSKVNSISITSPNATFNLTNGIVVENQTNIKNVAVGTFNTQAIHNGTIIISDHDGGSVNFTNSTVNSGIEVKPNQEATQPLLIRGQAPFTLDNGDATIRIVGNAPKVILEGVANAIIIEAENSEFLMSDSGDASKIIVAPTAKGSKIITSNYYKYELTYLQDQTVSDLTESGLFGDQIIRVVGYPSESENIHKDYLLKLDGNSFSTIYTFEQHNFLDSENYETTINNKAKFAVSKDERKVYFEGEITGEELRAYLESKSQELFQIDPNWSGDGKVAISYYDVKTPETKLIASGTSIENKDIGMRVLVGPNNRHALYELTLGK